MPEVMFDPGSKTVYVAPYREVQIPQLLARNGAELNWYYNPVIAYQGAMPSLDQNGVNVVHQTTPINTVDALNLFYHGSESLYFEIPFEYLPRPGLHLIPLQATTNAHLITNSRAMNSARGIGRVLAWPTARKA